MVVERPARPAGSRRDPYFGDYLAVWSGWAADPDLRFKGSSGGALSALARTALEHEVESVVMASGERIGTRTSAHLVDASAQVGDYASSRYAPVSTLSLLPVVSGQRQRGGLPPLRGLGAAPVAALGRAAGAVILLRGGAQPVGDR